MSGNATLQRARAASAGDAKVPAIRMRSLCRRFGNLTAVEHLTLDIADGEFFAMIGPSGCGKTTTLRMLAGLEEPSSGEIFVRGQEMTFVPPHRRPVSTVFQQYALFPHLNVFENVAFGLRERRLERVKLRARVGEMLDLVGLSGREKVRPNQLSGGQQQRVALARSLVLEPQVLLLDEPLGALDLKLRRQMQMLLKQVQRQVGITFVYVTHDQEEAFSMSDQVAVMNEGRLEQVGEPAEVYRRPTTHFVADFVGSVNWLPGTVTEVLGGGRYRVDLDAGGTTVICGADGLERNRKVVAIIRPEVMRPTSDDEVGPTISGQVRDVAFLGPHTSYVVDIGAGSPITVTVPCGGDEHHGTTANRFTWPVAATWLLPAQP